jgi:hypothetical protein
MNKFRFAMILALVALASMPAQAQTNLRVRGTITAVEGNVLLVKSREGRDLRLQLADNVGVAVAKAARFEDIKQGDYVGAAATQRADGLLEALEVHYLAPAVQEGSGPWDLAPGSTMTNANVAQIVQATGKRELTLQYKAGTQRIAVPEAAPIVKAVPGTRADLVAGEYVFTVAQVAPDGTMTVSRIQVSKDGVKPPQ